MPIAVLICVSALGCMRMRTTAQSDPDALYLSSTFRALVEGLYDGEVTCGELARHGDLGLGAIDGVDGELVMVDGTAYQVKADGSVHRVEAARKTPYALATHFDADKSFRVTEAVDFSGLVQRLDREFPNQNLPYAFRIEGTFPYVKARSVPAQQKPYGRLIEIIKNQAIFELQDVSGVIVGFRLPEHLESIGVPGYHFHFLTADRTAGGHLMAFRASELRIAGDLSPSVHLVLPENAAFASTDLTKADRQEMNTIMGRPAKK
jgi:acetolactate decarboxylase